MIESKDFNVKKYFDLMTKCIELGSDKDGKIPKTKLAKLMYLSDFAFFAENGKSITNAEYLKLEHGPVPKEYFSSMRFLAENEIIKVEKKGGAELISIMKNDGEDCLDADEIALIKKVCTKWKKAGTKEIVKFTHEQLPWAISFEGEIVPYSLIIQEENVY